MFFKSLIELDKYFLIISSIIIDILKNAKYQKKLQKALKMFNEEYSMGILFITSLCIALFVRDCLIIMTGFAISF